MNKQMSTIVRQLFASGYSALSNAASIRLVLILLIMAFVLATLLIPAVSTMASGNPPGGCCEVVAHVP